MNTYKNKETEVVILTDSELSGVWELVKTTCDKKGKEPKKVEEPKKGKEPKKVEE